MNICEQPKREGPDPKTMSLSRFMMEAERSYLEAALAITGNNRTQAAELAGISRSTLKEKLSRYSVTISVKLG
jgi:DNA-binding NtrC family response regulator